MRCRMPFVCRDRVDRLCLGYGSHVDEPAAVATFGKYNSAVDEGIQSVVLADAYIQARVVDCAALTLEDIACFSVLAAENFDA